MYIYIYSVYIYIFCTYIYIGIKDVKPPAKFINCGIVKPYQVREIVGGQASFSNILPIMAFGNLQHHVSMYHIDIGMCVQMYMWTHNNVDIYIYTCVYIYILHVCIYLSIYLFMYICVYRHIQSTSTYTIWGTARSFQETMVPLCSASSSLWFPVFLLTQLQMGYDGI